MTTIRLRATTVGVALVAAGMLAGCGDSQGSDSAADSDATFCEILDSDEYATAVNPAEGVTIGDPAGDAADALRDLRAVAPSETHDDIDVMIDGYESFAVLRSGMEVNDPATLEATGKLADVIEAYEAVDSARSEICVG